MNVLEALISECEPYTVPEKVLLKSLVDVGLDQSEVYSLNNSKKVYEAAAGSLSRYTVLASESEGGFSQGFDVSRLKERIVVMCEKAGIDASTFIQTPTIGTINVW